MKKEYIYMVVGIALGVAGAGMFVPFGDEKESFYDKLTKK